MSLVASGGDIGRTERTRLAVAGAKACPRAPGMAASLRRSRLRPSSLSHSNGHRRLSAGREAGLPVSRSSALISIFALRTGCRCPTPRRCTRLQERLHADPVPVERLEW